MSRPDLPSCLHRSVKCCAAARLAARSTAAHQQRKCLSTPAPGTRLPEEPLAGPSAGATAATPRTRSIIFDYTLPDQQDTHETLRTQRRRSFIADTEQTPQDAEDESKHHADPWSVLASTTNRLCLITRQRLPKGFLVAVRPALFPSKDPDGKGRLLLVPDDVLNRKFATHKKGKGFYATCRKDVVQALVKAKGFLGVVVAIPNLSMHAGIVDQVEEQLKTRIVQELELLRNRMTGHTPSMKSRVDSALERRPVLRRLAEDEAKPVLEEGIIPADMADGLIALIDVRGIPWPREKRTLVSGVAALDSHNHSASMSSLQLLEDAASKAKKSLANVSDPKVLDNSSLYDTADTPFMIQSPPADSKTSYTSRDLANTASTSEHPEVQSVPPSIPLIPQSSPSLPAIPHYPLAVLLSPTQQASARTFIGHILRLERRAAWQARRAAYDVQAKAAGLAGEPVLPFRPMKPPGTDDTANKDKEDVDKPKRLPSDILALYAYPSLTERGRGAGSSGVQLAMALWRMRLWFGQGWDESVIDRKGTRM